MASSERRGVVVRVAGAVLAAVALALAAGGMGADSPDGPSVSLTAASGAAKLTDSRGGGAILSAVRMRPGGSASGTVTIRNAGNAAGALALTRSRLTDTPGPGGGRLSDRLVLTVAEASGGRVVHQGPLATMPRRVLGNLAARASRAYRFTVALPAGADDNSYRDAATSVAFDWTATGAAPAPPRRPTGRGGSGGGRGSGTAPARDTTPPRLTLKAGKAQRLKRRTVTIRALCDEPCRIVRLPRGVKAGSAEIPAGSLIKVKLKLSKKSAKKLKARVRKRRKGSVRLSLTVADRAGNAATASVKVKLKR